MQTRRRSHWIRSRARRVKDGRLERVLHEPLAFDATVPGLRPWPWGRASDHEGRDHHRSAAARLHLDRRVLKSIARRHPSCPEFDIGHETYAAKLAKGSCSCNRDGAARALAGELRRAWSGGSSATPGRSWCSAIVRSVARFVLRPLALFAELWARNAQEAQTSARIIGDFQSRVVSFRSAPHVEFRAHLSRPPARSAGRRASSGRAGEWHGPTVTRPRYPWGVLGDARHP